MGAGRSAQLRRGAGLQLEGCSRSATDARPRRAPAACLPASLRCLAIAAPAHPGRPPRRAPEQFGPRHNHTIKVDIWGFGATFVHMVTGAPPWAGDSVLQICTAVGERPAGWRARAPARLGDAAKRAAAGGGGGALAFASLRRALWCTSSRVRLLRKSHTPALMQL